MRLFVAIPLPAALARHLAAWARNARLPGARWMREESLHLTLRFVGEVGAADLPHLERALAAAAASSSPFEVRLADPGMLPARGRARVAHLDLDGGERLLDVHGRVADAVEAALGLSSESRPFRPHVTLARSRRGWERDERRRWGERRLDVEPASFGVTYIDLMRSRTLPSGARYATIGSYALGD